MNGGRAGASPGRVSVMMSFRAVHAGAGYQYLLRSVATNDAYDPSTETGKLAGYYQAKGTPPGRWMGSGLAALGSSTAAAGEVVEADQMSALYGMGMHPDTHEMIDSGHSMDDCKLGGKFPTFTKGSDGQSFPVLDELRWCCCKLLAESRDGSVFHPLRLAACRRSQAASNTRLTITASGFGCP